MGQLVLVDKRRHRLIAQEHWGLTDEQMKGMHVHHRIPRSEGGTNDPSNLYVCSPWFHLHIWHGSDSKYSIIAYAELGGKLGGRLGGLKGKGRRKSEEHKRKIGLAHRGKVCPHRGKKCPWKSHTFSEESRMKMSEARKGVPKSEAHKQKLSKANKNVPILTCPHCGKQGKKNMRRWHFDNCKFNTSSPS